MKPAFLLVDLGNTRVKWAATAAHGPLRVAGDYPTAKVTATWIRTLAQKYSGHQLVLASVVPKWIPELQRAFGSRTIVVSGKLRIPNFVFAYPKPAELGADRIAAAVAAQAMGTFPAIIVACGTATAFTVLDAKGRLCGGVIATGLQAQADALVGSTAQLPATDLRMPRNPLAKSTRDAIRVGVLLGFQGGVKEILQHLGETFPLEAKPQVILTGGNARHLVETLEIPYKLRPLLVLEGLRIIGCRLGEAGDE